MRLSHAQIRAKERLGIDLDRQAIADIQLLIAEKHTLMIGRDPEGAERHLVMIKGTLALIVWLPKHRQIKTVLSPLAATKAERKAWRRGKRERTKSDNRTQAAARGN